MRGSRIHELVLVEELEFLFVERVNEDHVRHLPFPVILFILVTTSERESWNGYTVNLENTSV